MSALLGLVGKLAGLFGVHVNHDVLTLFLVLVAALLVALVNAKAGLVVLGVLGVLNLQTIERAVPAVKAAVWQTSTSYSLGVPCGGVEPILATIRTKESGGNYRARSPYASASGAYQFIDATWRGLGGTDFPGSGDAGQASPEEQDAVARGYVKRILAANGGNVEKVPVVWYVGDPSPEMDVVPRPDAGNKLTPRQYQSRWMAEYERQTAACAGEVK